MTFFFCFLSFTVYIYLLLYMRFSYDFRDGEKINPESFAGSIIVLPQPLSGIQEQQRLYFAPFRGYWVTHALWLS